MTIHIVKAPKWNSIFKYPYSLNLFKIIGVFNYYKLKIDNRQLKKTARMPLLNFEFSIFNFPFYTAILLLFFSQTFLTAQSLSRTYSKEIQVMDTVTIHSKGSLDLNWEMHGEIHSKGTADGYEMISGSAKSPITIKLHHYHIHTWEKDQIQQSLKITVTPDEDHPEDAKRLLDRLQINLESNEASSITIDDNMNIKKMKFTNGWFRADKNTIILDDESVYHFASLEISPALYIPKTSNLNLITDYIGVIIGDLEGRLVIKSIGGKVQANNVQHLKAMLRHCMVRFNHIGLAEVNAEATEFSAEHIDKMIVGSLALAKYAAFEESPSLFSLKSTGYSALNKYFLGHVGQLSVAETTSDEFQIASVDKLISLQSTFSNYHIDELKKILEISVRSGDVNIGSISEGFGHMDIFNTISTITLGLKKTNHFNLSTYANPFTTYTIPSYLQQIEQQKGQKKNYLQGDKEKAGKIDIRCESCKVIFK